MPGGQTPGTTAHVRAPWNTHDSCLPLVRAARLPTPSPSSKRSGSKSAQAQRDRRHARSHASTAPALAKRAWAQQAGQQRHPASAPAQGRPLRAAQRGAPWRSRRGSGGAQRMR